MAYKLHFDNLGRGHNNIDIIVDDFNEIQMNKVQKYLMSRNWEWQADLETMTGFIDVAFMSFPFTITKIGEHNG